MKKIVIYLLIAVMFSGCATIICGTRQYVNINSVPDDATVYIIRHDKEDLAIGKTPLSTKIKRNTPRIVLKKEGYIDIVLYSKKIINKVKTKEGSVVTITKTRIAKYNPVVNPKLFITLGNIFFFPIIGSWVDYFDGSTTWLPKNMEVEMIKGVTKEKIETLKIDSDNKKAVYLITTSELNLRKGAGTNYDVIKTIKKDSRVKLINKTNNDWCEIEYDGSIGFVSLKYLKNE
ncbi:MAG: SH3 domain-containing protein [Bacteroidota bacterium]